jgi:hypothetical protein
MNGTVIPVTGSIPIFIPILMKKCDTRKIERPAP